jgi:hypothetical protein
LLLGEELAEEVEGLPIEMAIGVGMILQKPKYELYCGFLRTKHGLALEDVELESDQLMHKFEGAAYRVESSAKGEIVALECIEREQAFVVEIIQQLYLLGQDFS